MKKQIINIINFTRGTETRDASVDVLQTTKNQMERLKRLGLRATFLFQYDALSDKGFIETALSYAGLFEYGLWLEVTRACVSSAGEIWLGRDCEWDWRGKIGNLIGYKAESRPKMIDAAMNKFKDVFGYFPKSVGSWALDAVTLKHLQSKYDISAACNCREQWGTDGFTMWGGYYGQAYYPSKYNSLCPAQTPEAQIGIPVFRMLGSDPVYQYDAGLSLTGGPSKSTAITLETICTEAEGYVGGGVPYWVDWFFRENFNGKCLSFGYAQAGQENSFGWKAMKDGFIDQTSKISKLEKEGKLEAVTMSEAGEWYKKNYKLTPPSAITAENDWQNKNRKSYWYNCKNYRINLYFDGEIFYIRDFFLFEETYKERYLNAVCDSDCYVFDNLPVMDGYLFSGNGVRAGLYPADKKTGKGIKAAGAPVWKDIDGRSATVTVPAKRFGKIIFTFSEDGPAVSVEKAYADFVLTAKVSIAGKKTVEIKDATVSAVLSKTAEIKDAETIGFTHNGFRYALSLICGAAYRNERGELCVGAETGRIEVRKGEKHE